MFVVLALTLSLSVQAGSLPGDANCDGHVSNFDIDPFVVALLYTAQPAETAAPNAYLALGATPECWAQRAVWGDVDRNGTFNNFDIDSFVSCVLGAGLRTDSGCGVQRGVVQDIVTPASGRRFLLYVPQDFDPNLNPVVVSIPGTDTTPEQEMGPHTRPGFPDGWPDCGGPTWPQLAEDRDHFEAFTVIVPEIYFGGANATICNRIMDAGHITATLQYLVDNGIIVSNGRWDVTGWSSGGSLAYAFAIRHWTTIAHVFVRYSSIDDIPTWNYLYNIVQDCLSFSECEWDGTNWVEAADWAATCTRDYDWHQDDSLRAIPIDVVNNTAEPFGAATDAMIEALAQENPPFTLISQTIYESMGSPQSCDAGPYGGHYEARELAAQVFAGW